MSARLASALLCLYLAAACAPQPGPLGLSEAPVDPKALLDGCCIATETLPAAAVRLLAASADRVIPSARAIRLRDSHLAGQPEAQAYFRAVARPMDVLFVAQRAPLASRFVTGYFNHVALYLGTEAQLRTLGVWDDPRFAPLRPLIAEGRTVIESSGEGVRMIGPEEAFDVDGLAVLRPTDTTPAQRRQDVLRAASLLGAPFDFLFDLDTPDTLYCVEYVQVVMPDRPLPDRMLYGQRVAIPDEIVAEALRGTLALDPVTFIWATPDGWSAGGPDLLARTLDAAWPRPSGSNDATDADTCP